LQIDPPIDPSSLTRWRKRLGEAGVYVSLTVLESLAEPCVQPPPCCSHGWPNYSKRPK
jgi:hypothetical protein